MIFLFVIKPSVCHVQLFFITDFQQSSFFSISFPNTTFPIHVFKTLSTFPHIPIKIPPRNDDFSRTSKVSLTRHFIIKTLPLCCPYAHIIRITFISKVSTISITLSLFLLTSTTLPNVSFSPRFQPLQILHQFPDQHNLYLLPEVPTKRAPRSFNLTFCMQHTSTLLFLSSSHSSVFLPQIHTTFNVSNFIQ